MPLSRSTSTVDASRVTDAADDARDREEAQSRPSVADPEQSVLRRKGGADAYDDQRTDGEPRSNAVVTTLRFVYRHSTALVPASLLWVICSLPVVTVGPASVGVYATVLSLRETGGVDRERVVETVRETLLPATLLGLLPMIFVGISSLYVLSGLATGIVGTALTAAALYAGLYLGVLLIPTFVSLASGVAPRVALRESYLWLASAPVTGLQLLLVTVVLLVATLGLSVGFVLLFAGVTAAYHVEVVARATTNEAEALPSLATAHQ
jgi:hypothetical protein